MQCENAVQGAKHRNALGLLQRICKLDVATRQAIEFQEMLCNWRRL